MYYGHETENFKNGMRKNNQRPIFIDEWRGNGEAELKTIEMLSR